jgi:hypothetical protein
MVHPETAADGPRAKDTPVHDASLSLPLQTHLDLTDFMLDDAGYLFIGT